MAGQAALGENIYLDCYYAEYFVNPKFCCEIPVKCESAVGPCNPAPSYFEGAGTFSQLRIAERQKVALPCY